VSYHTPVTVLCLSTLGLLPSLPHNLRVLDIGIPEPPHAHVSSRPARLFSRHVIPKNSSGGNIPNTPYQRSFRPKRADAFSPRSSANESACEVEESLFDLSHKPSPLVPSTRHPEKLLRRQHPLPTVIPTGAGRRFFPSFVRERVGLRSGGISLRFMP